MTENKIQQIGVSAEAPGVTDPERHFLRWILKLAGRPRVAIRLWNGEEIYLGHGPPVATAEICDRRTLLSLLTSIHIGFGEGYSAGRIRIHGDLVEFIREFTRSDDSRRNHAPTVSKIRSLLLRARANSPSRSRDNVHHHYDLGNDFYRLWLDERMLYTCAYYTHPDATLEQAQLAKMDHVCRKLELKPGQTVVEAGCGWGALSLHMAKHYGVTVRAYNISEQQIIYARALAKKEGLDGQVEFIEDDYRNITGQYDRFVSVGMLEHVGLNQYPVLGKVLQRCLKQQGRGLIHTIGRDCPRPLDAWIRKRIFPGAHPPSLSEMAPIFESGGFSILDIENLRLHYARTCRAWLDRYERVTEEVEKMYSPDFVRAWRLYLAGSVAGFLTGKLQLYQVVFVPPGNNDVPWTRDHLVTPDTGAH